MKEKAEIPSMVQEKKGTSSALRFKGMGQIVKSQVYRQLIGIGIFSLKRNVRYSEGRI